MTLLRTYCKASHSGNIIKGLWLSRTWKDGKSQERPCPGYHVILSYFFHSGDPHFKEVSYEENVKLFQNLNRHFPKKIYRWPWKMLSTINHQGSANPNHRDITSHLSEWLISKRQQITSTGENVERREPSCTVGGNVNWWSNYGKQYGDSSKN